MGFWDNAKKVANVAGGLASNALDAVDKALEEQAKRASDQQLMDLLAKHPNNKYCKAEAEKRGIA